MFKHLQPFPLILVTVLAFFATGHAADTPPIAPTPAAPVAPPLPADGVLLRYKYKSDATLKLTGALKITQTYTQSDQEKPVSRDAAIDLEGEMSFQQVAADGSQAVTESRIKSTTEGESTFTKFVQRIDSLGQLLKDQTDLPAPKPDVDPDLPSPDAPPAPAAPATPPAAPAVPAIAPVSPAPAAPAATAATAVAPKAVDAAPLQPGRMVLPEGKLKLNDTWTVESRHVQTGAAGAPVLKDTMTVTLKEFKTAGGHNIAVLAFKMISTPEKSLGGLQSFTSQAGGESEFDIEAGAVVKSAIDTESTAQAVTDKVTSSLKIQSKATYTITVEGGGSGAADAGPGGGRKGPRAPRPPGGNGGPGGGGQGGGGGGP